MMNRLFSTVCNVPRRSVVMNKSTSVKTGTEVRCYCSKCELEYEVLLEPKMAEMDYDEMRQQPNAGVREANYCPFCGGTEVEGE